MRGLKGLLAKLNFIPWDVELVKRLNEQMGKEGEIFLIVLKDLLGKLDTFFVCMFNK